MIFWLDWKLFGDGRGLASPYFDDAFYWLKDMSDGDRKKAKGRFYTFSAGLGAQLQSIEWLAPKAGTRRILFGQEFVVFSVSRNGPRVRVAWRAVGVNSVEDVRQLHEKLRVWRHGL